MRPLTREHAGVRRERPGGRRTRRVEANRGSCQLVEPWRGRTVVSVEAQALGADVVHDDQEQVRPSYGAWRQRRPGTLLRRRHQPGNQAREHDQPSRHDRRGRTDDRQQPWGKGPQHGRCPGRNGTGHDDTGDRVQPFDGPQNSEGQPADGDRTDQLMGPSRIPPAQPRESETGDSEEEHVGGRNHPDEMAVRAQALERNPVEERAMGEHQTSFEQPRQETKPDHQEKQVEWADMIMSDRSGSPILRSIDSLASQEPIARRLRELVHEPPPFPVAGPAPKRRRPGRSSLKRVTFAWHTAGDRF